MHRCCYSSVLYAISSKPVLLYHWFSFRHRRCENNGLHLFNSWQIISREMLNRHPFSKIHVALLLLLWLNTDSLFSSWSFRKNPSFKFSQSYWSDVAQFALGHNLNRNKSENKWNTFFRLHHTINNGKLSKNGGKYQQRRISIANNNRPSGRSIGESLFRNKKLSRLLKNVSIVFFLK